MKPRACLVALLAFAAAFFAGCSSSPQVSKADPAAVPVNTKVLGRVSVSGTGAMPPAGALRNLLVSEAERKFGRKASELEIGLVDYDDARPVGRDIQYDNHGVGEDGSRFGTNGEWWSAAAQVSLRD